MPVNIPSLSAEQLLPIEGLLLGVTEAAIKKPNRKDLLVIALESSAKITAVFTQNRFCAAPVVVAKAHLSGSKSIRALVVNTGNANAGTGEVGIKHANATCIELAKLLGCDAQQVLPFSTGVIMEPLPVGKIIEGLPAAITDLQKDYWFVAAEAIMTTDTVPKAVSRQVTISGKSVTITGIAKGSGMIHPDMATMLGFVATDAKICQPLLDDIIRYATDNSFNCITVDGDTSTNDAFVLIATGCADHEEITDKTSAEFTQLQTAITAVSVELAQMIVRDGEGASKFITVSVESGKNQDECAKIAYAISHSPLVKTAFFASDPNLGRILAAIGYAGVDDLDVNGVQLYLDDTLVAEQGGRARNYTEEAGQRVMEQSEITVRVVLNRGDASKTVWTCDFSYDYIRINADYRT